jgi:hypothetical protein
MSELSPEELEYLQKYPFCKKLSNDLDREALWSTHLGARTINDAIETEKLCSAYRKRENELERNQRPAPSWGMAMELRNERCIDQNGCSSILW